MKNTIRMLITLGAVSASTLPHAATPQQPIAAPPSTCELHADATLPLIEDDGRFLVNVNINGIDQALLIDTSAVKTTLTPEAADALNLPTETCTAQTLAGVGPNGQPVYPRIVASLKFGTEQWSDLRVPTFGPHAFATHNGVSPAGVLGANVLSRYDVELDFPHRTMKLYTAQNCLGRFAPWQGDYQSYSPIYTNQHRFVMQMALNHRPILAILDTGATPSLIGHSGAQRVGLDSGALQQDPQRVGHGLNGAAVSFAIHRFDTMQISSREFQNVNLDVSDAMFHADMLLGMDFLKWRRVWLSYSTGWVFMQLDADNTSARTAQTLPSRFGSPSADEWADTSGIGQTAAIVNQGGATPPTPIARFSTHSHMTYFSSPRIVQQTRLQPPPPGMVPLHGFP